MTTFVRSRRRRCAALLLSLAVLHGAPGLAAYSALAVNLKAGRGAAGPVRVNAAVGSGAMVSPAGLVLAASLNGSLNMGLAPVLSAPSDAPVIAAPAAAAPVSAASALQETVVAVEAVEPGASDAPSASALPAMPVLGRLFDGLRVRSANVSAPVPGAASAFAPLSAPADGPAVSGSRPPAPPSGPDDPVNAAPGRARLAIGLALAIGGGAGAWHAAPVLIPFLLAALGYLPFAVPALPLVACKALVTALGAGAGLAAFHTKTWRSFPADLKDTAVGAARATFRFWARFGLIFDAVLRGKPTDEAMKAELPAGILKYPLIAMPFAAVGYALAPVAFALGAAWRLVGTPVLAALRGAREVAVGFFPWLGRALRVIGNILRNFIPFAAGFVWGGLRGLFFAGAAGALVLAGPLFRDAVAAKYEPLTLPGWIGYRLLQLAGLAATAVLGLAGFAAGVLVSPPHALLAALERAFDWSGASPQTEAFFKRWLKALSNDAAFTLLLERGFPAVSAETLNARRVRLANNALIGAASALALPFLSLATLIRSVSAAARGERTPDADVDWDKTMPRKGAERPVDANPAGPVIPAVLAPLGAVIGVTGYEALVVAGLIPGGLPVIAAWAVAGMLGAALGLALSQLMAVVAIPGRAASDARDGAVLAWGGWTDAGKRVVAAILGTEKASWLGMLLAAVPGALMTLLSGFSGVAYAVVTGLVKASWTGFMELASRFLPALRRFLSLVARVLKNILPFASGFLWGSLVGLLKTSFAAAVSFFKPVIEAFEAEEGGARPSEAQVGLGLLLGLTLALPALAVFLGGLALGATLGLPVILTFGLARGVKWASSSESSAAYWRAWERGIGRAAQDALKVVSGVFEGVGSDAPVWRLYVRVASVLLGSPVTAVVLVAAGAKAYLKSFAYARVLAGGGQVPAGAPERDRRSSAPSQSPVPPAAPPAGKPPVVLTAVMGAAGLAAGAASVYFFGLPFLASLAGWTLWAGYAGVFAGLPLLGLATGLALTQPVFWVNLIPLVREHGKAGMTRSYEYWRNSGDAALEGLFGVKRGSLLTAPHRAVGGVLGAFWALGGMAYGAGAALLTGAYEGARQVVYEMLPFLRTAFETAMKVLRRVVPFVFGLLAGLASGVVGSAAFGALLLGRPYFRHVVAQDFERRGALAALGNLILKLAASVLGALFGLGGAALGVIAALPYALTASLALAFRFAGIGGPVQRFFDHWSYGALREEMRRIDQLTSKLKFEDAPEGRAPSLAAGWIRMANIFPATFAAVFAAAVAGYVSYARSLVNAYKSSTSGRPIPQPAVDEGSRREWDRAWGRAGHTARGFLRWAIAGASIGFAIWAFSSWTPLGLAGWLLVGAAAGLGTALALSAAAVIALVALLIWISGQLR